MQALIKILRQLIALFVDDGRLAVSILVWIALCGLLVRFGPEGLWQGPTLFVGLALILIESALRGGKRRPG